MPPISVDEGPMLTTLIDILVQGILLGGLYALFAAGLSLIFGVMRLGNLAHGDLIVLAAYLILGATNPLGGGRGGRGRGPGGRHSGDVPRRISTAEASFQSRARQRYSAAAADELRTVDL